MSVKIFVRSPSGAVRPLLAPLAPLLVVSHALGSPTARPRAIRKLSNLYPTPRQPQAPVQAQVQAPFFDKARALAAILKLRQALEAARPRQEIVS